VLLPVLLLVTALIVYGSLYPWQFHAAVIPGNPLAILLQSWSFEFNRYSVRDTGVNLVLYMPFGAACYLWLAGRAHWLRFSAPLVLALGLSSSMEMIQLFDGTRVCSMLDVLTNVTGAAIGMSAATRFRSRVSIRPGAGGPLLLISCWVCANLFPFMPDLSTHHLLAKLATFTSPPFSVLPCFSGIVMWLAALRLLDAAYKSAWFPLLLLALPLRLFVSTLTLAWTDVVPAAAAYVLWYALPRRDSVLAALAIAGIVLTGLAPFHFSAVPQGFNWIPFRPLFSTDWQSGFGIFFRKCFAYGSAIWLVNAAGIPLATSTVSVALMLAVLEGVQLCLPNHVSESTDPLHALILGWILYQLRATKPQVNASVRL
jgi:VanZ like family